MRLILLALASLLAFSTTSRAQTVKTISNDDWCSDKKRSYNNSAKERLCEVREITLSSRDDISIDGGVNGGISIESWDKNEILIRAKVQAYSSSKKDAEDIMAEIKINTRGIIEADVPRLSKREHVSVTYKVYVPENIDLDLETFNGGISISGVNGDIRFETLNGGAQLNGLSGNVKGKTTNGGIQIELTGTEWKGDELNVRTTNGGVLFKVPKEYNAQLETGTVNGSLNLDFPVTVSGRINKSISVTIGDGGKLVSAKTTNGGVKIRYSDNSRSR